MPREDAPYFCASLTLDYLSSEDSTTAGVPSDAVLPKVIMDHGQLQQVPGLVIAAEESRESSAQRRNIHIVFALLFRNRATGEDAADDADSLAASTPRDVAGQYLDAIESRLMDRAAFSAFLASLPEERRAGFVIMKWRRLPHPQFKRGERPTEKFSLFCAFEMQVFWARQSAA